MTEEDIEALIMKEDESTFQAQAGNHETVNSIEKSTKSKRKNRSQSRNEEEVKKPRLA